MTRCLVRHTPILAAALLLLGFGACRGEDTLADTTPANPVLARDSHFHYMIADLRAYLRLTGHSLADDVAQRVVDKDPAALKAAEGEIKNYAFQRLYAAREAGDLWDDAIRARVRRDLWDYARGKMNERFADQAAVSASEIEEAYKSLTDLPQVPERRKISILYKLFPPDEKGRDKIIQGLEELRRRADLNERFLEIVKVESDLPNALRGGVVDFFTAGTYGPTVEKHAFATPKGELSPVFWASKGAYIVKVLDVRPAGPPTLDDMRSQLKTEIRQRKFANAQSAALAELKIHHPCVIPSTFPSPMPPDFPLLKVGDFTITSATLPLYLSDAADPGAPLSPDALKAALETTCENELYLRKLEDEARADPESLSSRELAVKRDLVSFFHLFGKGPASRIVVPEEEVRAYYEKHKEYYHDVAPRRLRMVVFKVPNRDELSEPEYHKAWTALMREARSFADEAAKDPERFDTLGAALAEKNPAVELRTSDWLEECPPDWQPAATLTEYSPRRVSSVVQFSEGLLVFRTTEVGTPRSLSYEEARPKAERVILSREETKLYSSHLNEVLERHRYRFVWGE